MTLLKALLAFLTQSVSVLPPRTKPAVDRSLLSIASPILLSLYTKSCRYSAKYHFISTWFEVRTCHGRFTAANLTILYKSIYKNELSWFGSCRQLSELTRIKVVFGKLIFCQLILLFRLFLLLSMGLIALFGTIHEFYYIIQIIFCQLILLFRLFLLLFTGPTALFGTIHEFYCTISANFYFYL